MFTFDWSTAKLKAHKQRVCVVDNSAAQMMQNGQDLYLLFSIL